MLTCSCYVLCDIKINFNGLLNKALYAFRSVKMILRYSLLVFQLDFVSYFKIHSYTPFSINTYYNFVFIRNFLLYNSEIVRNELLENALIKQLTDGVETNYKYIIYKIILWERILENL